jgi:molybdate transport system substrate-binding protein
MAAASTTDAVEQVRANFERLHPDVTVRVSYGASSVLARQIEAGGAADLFLSASTQWSDYLAERELVAKQRELLGNQLVIVVPADSQLDIKTPADLASASVRRLALADVNAVPAGVYARQALEKLKLWDAMRVKVTGAADVRQALQFVETGAAQAGIVYATDAASSKQVRVAGRIDPKLSDPIRYPLVLLKHGSNNRAAVALYGYLASPAAAAVFRKHGFSVQSPATPQP